MYENTDEYYADLSASTLTTPGPIDEPILPEKSLDQPVIPKPFPTAVDPESVRAHFPDIVPGLLPRETVSLLVHSAFAGMENFLLPQLNNYANPVDDLPFLDIAIPGPREQMGMILASGFPDEIDRYLRELDLIYLTKKTFPMVKWPVMKDQAEYFKGVELYLDSSYDDMKEKAGRSPGFIVIEDIHGLVPSSRINNADVIIELFNTLKEFCLRKHCTILGTIAESKSRPFGPSPSRILGSIQWPRNSSTVIGLECYKKGTVRKVSVYSKTAKYQIGPLWADFKEFNRLLLCSAPESDRETKPDRLTARLEEAAEGQEFTRRDLQGWGMCEQIRERTVDAWIADCIDKGRLWKKGNGYQKPQAN